jgi:hypothetical protein
MITAQQIKERLIEEKDPLQYIDGEVARRANQMGNRCGNIQDVISIYNQRVNENDQFDLPKIKDDLMKMGELYFEINTYLKVRKEQVKNQMRSEQVNKAMVKRKQCIEQKNKKATSE